MKNICAFQCKRLLFLLFSAVSSTLSSHHCDLCLSVNFVHIRPLEAAVRFVKAPRDDEVEEATRIRSYIPALFSRENYSGEPPSPAFFPRHICHPPSPEIRGGVPPPPGSMHVRECAGCTLSRFPLMCQKSEGM